MPLLARRFSITNFLIATSALGFQVFVLCPWHTKLDSEFAELRRENMKLIHMLESRPAPFKTTAPAIPSKEAKGTELGRENMKVIQMLESRPTPFKTTAPAIPSKEAKGP